MKNSFLLLGALVSGSVFSSWAFPIAGSGDGLPVFASGGVVTAKYEGNSAAFSNDLYLELDGSGQPGMDSNTGNDLFIFNNHATPVGTTMDLGDFPSGTELVFRLHVNNTGNNFLTGAASRNPDDHIHARVQGEYLPGTTLVSFEDLFNGPFDFNDLSFSFQNTVNQEPPPTTAPDGGATFALLGLGVTALGAFRRKSR